jgi:potassium efflux system protein
MKDFTSLLYSDQKWRVFGIILAAIVVIGTVLSLLAKVALIQDDVATRPRLAVVAPLDSPLGKSLRQGADVYVEALNRQGGYQGRQVEIMPIAETDQAAKILATDKRIIGVIGYLDTELLHTAAPTLEKVGLPIVTPLYLQGPRIPGVVSLGLDPREQARFAANYARNVVQQRLMYVIRESGSEFDALVEPFLDVYKRFDTPVRQVWTLPPGKTDADTLRTVLEQVRKVDIGAIYLATSPELSAQLVKGIRATGNALDIFGPEYLTTGVFTEKLKAIAGKEATVLSHGIVAATPVLFDTANDEAQRFQTRYQQKFQDSPDWLAILAHDAVKVALNTNPGKDEVRGLSGQLRFVDGQAQLPIQMGLYNGDSLISAPVQLLPISKGAGFNYIEALR